VKGKVHCAVGVVPTLAQRTRKNGAPPALVAQAGKASATRPRPSGAWTGHPQSRLAAIGMATRRVKGEMQIVSH